MFEMRTECYGYTVSLITQNKLGLNSAEINNLLMQNESFKMRSFKSQAAWEQSNFQLH